MEFNLAQLMKEHVGASRSLDLDARDVELTWVNPAAHVQGTLQAIRMPRGVLVRGTVRTTAEGTCSRCLEAVSEPLELEIDEEFFQTVDVTTGRPVHHDDPLDEDAQLIGDDHVIDLTDVIRQTALVALPLTFLCRPDCKGLCPECGLDRNTGACSCDEVDPASPFAVLRRLNVS